MSIALVLSILTCMAAAVFSLRGGTANQPERDVRMLQASLLGLLAFVGGDPWV